ncbi:hypothetical protein MMC30_002051 [Trapelia coarctata]|nr:hypothetical protein [Trapelia coarctata]
MSSPPPYSPRTEEADNTAHAAMRTLIDNQMAQHFAEINTIIQQLRFLYHLGKDYIQLDDEITADTGDEYSIPTRNAYLGMMRNVMQHIEQSDPDDRDTYRAFRAEVQDHLPDMIAMNGSLDVARHLDVDVEPGTQAAVRRVIKGVSSATEEVLGVNGDSED